ncbi:MAG: helix-turn-helix domain-containing protein, partial [Bacteroidetes bacterium]|nr:helix-turn-helix domain-containing protein [Bacteroidota bacterium]
MSLSQDLEQIRIYQKLSRETVHSISKIAIYIIEAIENGTIFDDSTHITYQRSYIRTYAKVLKIDDAEVVHALDEHYSGNYKGSLGQKYITGELIQENAPVVTQNNHYNESANHSEITQEIVEPQEETPKPRKIISEEASDITRIPELNQSAYNKTKVAPNVSSVNWAS